VNAGLDGLAGQGRNAWFPRDEFVSRVHKVQSLLKARGLDALIAFQPESVTYLTGFFTRGYSTFQFAVIPADGDPGLFCRDVAAYYLESTAVFSDHSVWADGDDRLAAAEAYLNRKLGKSPRVAIEMSAWQLTAERWEQFKTRLPGYAFADAEDLVQRLRFIKSANEISYQRRAGAAAEAGMAAGRAAAKVGASEREVAAEVCAAMIRAGSDLPGPGPLSSGERAYHLHGGYTDRILEYGDTLQVECTPSVRYYHARFMRTLKIGKATPEERAKLATIIAVQDRALAEVAPGRPAAMADQVYREGILGAGLRKEYTNKTFYSIGLMIPPVGGEPLEAAPGCTWTFEPGMTFHTYVLADSFGFSETITITHNGYERLTNYPRELIVT
jgi:Xaa-Pro dipeptidase